MPKANRFEQFMSRYPNRLVTIDSHTAGEATRMIVAGIPKIPGDTIFEKRLYLKTHWDHYRLILTREPRGSRETVGAVITEPVTAGAAVGIIFMDAHRYPYMCGHGTIGVVTTLIETGLVKTSEPYTTLSLDTPSGLVQVTARVQEQKVQSVTIQIVPCFAYSLDQTLHVADFGDLCIDIVYAGGFFAMVDSSQLPFAISPQNVQQLAQLGMRIIDAGNEQLSVQHPELVGVNTIDVAEFYDQSEYASGRGRGAVVYGDAHVDRSPCGTGTAAKMALLHRRGKLNINQQYINAGILGTTFEARLISETMVGDFSAVIPEITGSAWIIGFNQFVIDPRDPFPQGFLL